MQNTERDTVSALIKLTNVKHLRQLVSTLDLKVREKRARAPLEQALTAHYETVDAFLDSLPKEALTDLCMFLDLNETGSSQKLRSSIAGFVSTPTGIAQLESYGDTSPDYVEEQGVPEVVPSTRTVSDPKFAADRIAELSSTPITPSVDAIKLPPIVTAFKKYCDRRISDDAMRNDTHDEDFCPNCKDVHARPWITDKAYHITFYLCSTEDETSAVVSSKSSPGLQTISLAQFMTTYPSTPDISQKSWLEKKLPFVHRLLPAGAQVVARSCKISISPLPPFISLVLPLDDG